MSGVGDLTRNGRNSQGQTLEGGTLIGQVQEMSREFSIIEDCK